jgi:hypothetical protein
MRAQQFLGVLLISAALVFVSAAAAKDFEPGDLRLCNMKRCVPVVDQEALNDVGAFYYGARKPRMVAAPRLGMPYFELRFRNGYATGIVASAALDRFLSYGVNLDHFARGRWYRMPRRAAAELRRLGRSLEPLRLTRAAIRKSH